MSDSYIAPPNVTLRDWFAGQAMTAIVSKTFGSALQNYERTVAFGAYEIADALLAERSKSGEEG